MGRCAKLQGEDVDREGEVAGRKRWHAHLLCQLFELFLEAPVLSPHTLCLAEQLQANDGMQTNSNGDHCCCQSHDCSRLCFQPCLQRHLPRHFPLILRDLQNWSRLELAMVVVALVLGRA